MRMGDSRSLRESKEYIIAVTQYNMDNRQTPSESPILNPITHILEYPNILSPILKYVVTYSNI